MTPRAEYKLLVACELLIPRTIGSTNRAARFVHGIRVDSFVLGTERQESNKNRCRFVSMESLGEFDPLELCV